MAPRRPRKGRGAKDAPFYSTWTGAGNTWSTLSDMLGMSGSTTKRFTMAEALANATFLLCSDIIAQDHAKAKLRMFRRLDDIRREEVKPEDHQIARLLATRPNEFYNWPEFIELLVRHMAVTQNGYIGKRITTRGDIRELVPIVPGRVTTEVMMQDAELVYSVSRANAFEQVLLRRFGPKLLQEQMIHIRGRMLEGFEGLSTLIAGSGTLQLARAIQDYQNNLYNGGGSHKVVFSLNEDQELSNEQYERLQKQFQQMLQSALRNEKPLVLENGATVNTLTMSAKDTEVAATQKAVIVEVCRLFRMPPHKVMHLEAVKYENLGVLEKIYVSDTLLPYATKIEEALRLGLLSGDEQLEYFFEFDRDQMTATDAVTRAEIAKIGVQAGVLEVDEARRELGYDPLPDDNGQVRLVPVNVSIVDRDNEVIVNGSAGPAGGDNGAQSTDPAQQPAKPPANPQANPPAKLFAVPNR